MLIRDLALLFFTFFKIGILTFGGGYAMIPMIEDEVMRHGWLDSVDTLLDFIAVSESTPGPFAVNIATFIGYSQNGIIGAIAATLGVVLPSFIIISIIARFYTRFSRNRHVQGFLGGVKPVIVGILGSVALSLILRTTIHTDVFNLRSWVQDYVAIGIFLMVIVIYKLFPRLNPIYIILISAALGLGLYWLFPA